MFGSLIIVLPTFHEGGQFVLRRSTKEWTIDFTDRFASATVPSVCFLAFHGNVEHMVLPITSGYRVTLTYNLYHKPIHPITTSIPTPFHLELRQALADLVNDTSKLPEGGYLGFGLVHKYVHTGHNIIEPLSGQLKGSDRALADTCDALSLRYSIRLLYRDICSSGANLLTTEELDVSDHLVEEEEPSFQDYIKDALEGLSHEQVEGVFFVEQSQQRDFDDFPEDFEDEFCKSPVMEILEVTPMKSSVDVRSPVVTTGRRFQAELEYFYGTACMLVAVEPAASRHPIGL